MEHADIERLIDIISWGKTIIHDSSINLILRTPTPEEKARAALIYTQELVTATSIGVLTEADTLVSLIEFGQWSDVKEQEIAGIRKDIHNIRRGLLDFLFQRDKLEKARKLLRSAEAALTTRLIARQELVNISAETQALLKQQRYLISKVTEMEDGQPYWSSSDIFDEETNTELVQRLCRAFFEISIPNAVIRQIARSGAWRAIWGAAKQLGSPFNTGLTEWSDTQRELIHWSLAYDNVYEAYERPGEDVVEDDDLLDSWFIRQHEKMESRTNKAAGEDKIKGKDSRKGGKNEQFIMADQEGAKKIYNMNDPMARANIRARQKVLQQRGTVKEQHMPDSQREIKQQLTEMQRQHVKSIGSK